MRPSEPPCEVNIAVSIKEVKRQDLVVQDTVGLTMIDGNKKEQNIPFPEEVKYKFDSLMKNFVFKYAILQQEEILGVLYLEIPFKYKFTKKFKIEDWYPLKPFDGRPGNQIDNSLVARVVITYDSNCKLDPRKYESIEDLKEINPNTTQKDYKTELRKIRRTTTADKENSLNYLEEVERNIMNRRKRNMDNSGYASLGRTGSTDSTRILRSSSKTSSGLRGPLSRALTSRKKLPGAGTAEHNSITPDDMYRTAGSTTGRNGPNDDKVVAKMAGELTSNKQEIKDLRDKLKALQEGQMTVDNLQLSKRLDEERAQLNAERAKMLKEYVSLKEEAETLKKKAVEQKQRSEEDNIKQKQELEDKKRVLDLDLKQLALADDELRSKQDALSRREESIAAQERQAAQKLGEAETMKQEMVEYQLELNELKEKMMKERERILGDKGRFSAEKEELERDIKSLKMVKENLEREREREMKEVLKKKREVDAAEEKVARDKQSLEHELDRAASERAKLEEEVKRHKALSEELEEEKLKCWRDRNSLNLEVKQFIEDRKKMESDLKWRIKEVEQTQETLNKELKEIEKDKDDLNEYQDKLEDMKNDLESREKLLLHEREDFAKLKLKFIDGLLESGGLAYLTPELKQMARSMGIDVDQLEQERAKMESRRKELERLQRQNEDELAAIKAKVNSRGNSRRGSVSGATSTAGGRAPNTLMPVGGSRPNAVGAKLASEAFLTEMYDRAVDGATLQQLKETRQALDKLLEEKNFTQKIIEQLRNDNKQMKKDFDLLTKIIEQYRGDGLKIDLDSILGKSKPKDVSTMTEKEIGIDEEKWILETRLKDLESKMRRGSVAGQTHQTDAEEEEFDTRLRDITEQLKKLLNQIENEQKEYIKRGLPEIGQRIMNIHHLVYRFIQDIIQFLIRFHKPKDHTEREMFGKIISGLNIQQPVPALTSYQPAAKAPENTDNLSQLMAQLRELEQQNERLKEVIRGMKGTFDFFEFANDQYILGRP